ncbi:potassium channel family protein [Neolewinella litorea]|uniref:Potassium channel domain-containing protein n=1 Tax=Neolewinella litorea TaxID=2562452 RepID=A0A4S4NJD8_9BACT|nr:ion channel [Neolewinella litorea]THH39914.1 hypothetical protein E4021_09905 [Neolewinella litorea]
MNGLLFLGGIGVIAITLTDFIYTTLSCNGSGYLSTALNRILGRLLAPRSDGMRNWSGVLHLVASLFMWIALLLVGGFLVFIADTDFVVRATTKVPANLSERAYFTGFVFSTLGLGDYAPGSPLGRHLTAVYSLLGFAVLTTAITYILSVTNAVTKKKNLATFLSSLGESPSEMYAYFTAEPDGSLFSERVDDLVTQLNLHLNDHLSYPIVHYFHSDQRSWSAVLQLATLHECMLALSIHYADSPKVQAHLQRLDRCLNYFLKVAHIPDRLRQDQERSLLALRTQWHKEILTSGNGDPTISEASRALGALLRQAGYDWQDVFGQR